MTYPHDYHPLAPVLRQLRGALSWYQTTQTPLPQSAVEHLIARCKEIPRARSHDAIRPLKVAQHWSILSRQIDLEDRAEPLQNIETPQEVSLHINEGPLPATQFPVVVHERHVVESVSFKEPPPQDQDAHGSALLMRPSVNLKRHRGDLPDVSEHQASTSQDLVSIPSSTPSNSTVSSPTALAPQNSSWGQVSSPSEVSPERAQSPQADPRTQLWANQPRNSEPTDEAATSTTAPSKPTNPKLGSSLANLLRPSSAKMKTALQATSPSPARAQSERHVASVHVRHRGYDADERYAHLCEHIWRCQNCPRHSEPHFISSGHYGARLMFVVAHPSESDLENGRILMAQPERELFHQILKALSLSRLDVYVTSLLKCGATLPKEQDWTRCQGHFLNELELVQPDFIISLGYMASIILLGDHVRPGVWGRYQDLDVMPTLHPQDILSGGDGVKRKAWRHLKEVMRRAGLSSH